MIWRWILFNIIGPIFTILAERHNHYDESDKGHHDLT